MRRRLMRQHQKHVQDLEPDRRHDEEIDRHQCFQVIIEERPPGLRGRRSTPDHVLADARLADVDAELEQFAVNVRSAPERILLTQYSLVWGL